MQSAGQTIKMVSYGVALLGLVVSATIYLHVSILDPMQWLSTYNATRLPPSTFLYVFWPIHVICNPTLLSTGLHG
jgi:hypothetical protein